MSGKLTHSIIPRSWSSRGAQVRGVTVSFLLTMLLAGQATFAADNPIENLQRGARDTKNTIAKSMTQAAWSAGVPILTDEIAIATRGDILVANALVASGKEALEKQDQISFVYLAFPSSHACSKTLPAGFYTISISPESVRTNLRAQIVNSERKAVAEFPLKNEMMMGTPDPTAKGVVSFAEVSIQQSQLNMANAVVGVHRTICYPNGVWYWTWIVVS